MQKTINIKANGHTEEDITLHAEEVPTDRHTDEIQDIITKVPSWILRWGITLFFGILLMAVGISVLVRYPDTIKTNLRIASNSLPTPVISPISGSIAKVFVEKGTIVNQGQPLLAVETSNDAPLIRLNAPQGGKVSFSAIVQPGEFLVPNQVVFTIHPLNEQFYGILEVPGDMIAKIKEGQQVLISIRGYDSGDYDKLQGKISYIADEPVKGGFFMVKVNLDKAPGPKGIELKSWMIGNAEIITQDATILSRITKNIFKSIR